MSPLRVLRGFIFGAIGGLIGWLLIEFLPLPYPFQPRFFDTPTAVAPLTTPPQQALLGLALGLAIGGCLGLAEGMSEGTRARFNRVFWTFVVLGSLGGFIGLYFGQALFATLGGKVSREQISPAEFFPQLLTRSLAWTLIGLFLGMVFGVPNLSFRRMWNGAVGGAIGGFLGGFVLQILWYLNFPGMQGRFLGFMAMGAAIGFFINLVAEAMKRVWVKVLVGRNEGREHVLDTALAYVGRDELADVPVFLDPAVPKRMASFRQTGGRYALFPESNQLPITVNGQPLTPGYVLRDGDAIQFGRVTLGYNEKASATGMRRPVDSIPLAEFGAPPLQPVGSVAIPQGGSVCEFCAQVRDPATGACACSVGADGAYAQPNGYGYDQPPAGGYAAPAGYGAPDPYGTPAYGAPQDPAYAATMMAPGPGGYGMATGAAQLVAIDGPHTGQVFPLQGMEAGIGREPSQEIAISADGTASRRHARVYQMNGSWVLRDEGSSNGTWVNGVRIQEQPLFPGDVVRIGNTQFRFEA
jgi:pSer/pThr/pTyr-binding forkhead associated (FHA) protein